MPTLRQVATGCLKKRTPNSERSIGHSDRWNEVHGYDYTACGRLIAELAYRWFKRKLLF